MSWVIWRAATGSCSGCGLPPPPGPAELLQTQQQQQQCLFLRHGWSRQPTGVASTTIVAAVCCATAAAAKWNKNIYIYYYKPALLLSLLALFPSSFLPFHPALCVCISTVFLYFLFKPCARTRPYSCLVRITIGNRTHLFSLSVIALLSSAQKVVYTIGEAIYRLTGVYFGELTEKFKDP